MRVWQRAIEISIVALLRNLEFTTRHPAHLLHHGITQAALACILRSLDHGVPDRIRHLHFGRPVVRYNSSIQMGLHLSV